MYRKMDFVSYIGGQKVYFALKKQKSKLCNSQKLSVRNE